MQGAGMTLTECYKALHGYFKAKAAPIVVQMAFQNAPTPATPYISLARPTAKRIGTERKWTGTTETVRTQYEGRAQLWATCGTEAATENAAAILQRIAALLGSSKSLAYFQSKGIAILGFDGPNDIPRLDATSFVNEATATIRFYFCDDATEASTDIAFEEITNNIGAN